LNTKEQKGVIRIYHGSLNASLTPVYYGGMDYHDYGNGFYCTEDFESAKEWACQHEGISESYVYLYDIDIGAITPVLDMSVMEPVYWLSALAQYRYGRNEPALRRERRQSFIDAFPVNCEQSEVIIGWRANDRYFAYLKYFLNSDISYEAVVQAIMLGNLGKQVVIKGQQAYKQLVQAGDKLVISGDDYTRYNRQYLNRENEAGEQLKIVRDIKGRTLSDMLAKGVI
jgi:hypothetical protein